MTALERTLWQGNHELRRKLAAAHRELERRRRRDEELALHMPALVARLQSIAADAVLDLRAPAEPPSEDFARDGWAKDPAIDWTGIDGGHPSSDAKSSAK